MRISNKAVLWMIGRDEICERNQKWRELKGPT